MKTIYKFIEEAYFNESNIFPDDFIKQCKDNTNEAKCVTLDVKKHGLYAQVVKLRRKYLRFIAANKNKIEAKSKFQDLSARSHCWFDIDFD